MRVSLSLPLRSVKALSARLNEPVSTSLRRLMAARIPIPPLSASHSCSLTPSVGLSYASQSESSAPSTLEAESASCPGDWMLLAVLFAVVILVGYLLLRGGANGSSSVVSNSLPGFEPWVPVS